MRYENITRKNRMQRSRRQRGQALAEYALVTPLILFVSMGIIDFGRAIFSYSQASFQIRTALRTGAVTETGGGGEAYKDCAALAAEVKDTLFIPTDSHDLKIRFIRQSESDLTNPIYVPCYDDSQTPKVPALWATDQDTILQGDLIEVNDQIAVQLITPFFPQTLNFNMTGRRTVVTAITLPSTPGDSDFDGLDDQWECLHFGSVGLICDDTDPSFDDVAFDAMLAGQNAADDPDADGCNNGCEEGRGGDPNDNDTDNDTLLDGAEAYTHATDLTLPDTDGDSDTHSGEAEYATCKMNDNDEVALGTDALAADSDLDGVDDWVEVCQLLTDPLGAPTIDTPILEHWPAGSDCSAVLPADRYIGLNWDALPDVEGYYIYIDGSVLEGQEIAIVVADPADGEPSQCGGAIGACTSLFGGWDALDSYSYQVRGYFGAVLGPLSNTINLNCNYTAVGQAANVTQRPEGSGSSCSQATAAGVRYQGLQWDAVAGVTGYYVYADGTRVGDVNTTQCGDAPAPGTCFNVDASSWDPLVSISYEVIAHAGDVLGPPSSALALACDNP